MPILAEMSPSLSPTGRLRRHLSCPLFSLLAVAFSCCLLPSSLAAAASRSAASTVSCQSCVFYANIRVPISSQSCLSAGSAASVDCQPGHACKMAFLQDSQNATVYASRGCERTGAFSGTPIGMTVLVNARTTMYCTGFGCNNNWAGRAAVGEQQRQLPLHCWVGYGRHIDQFRLEPCSEAVLRLAQRGGNASSGGGGGGGGGGSQTPVCMLVQFARQIDYAGGVFESAAYMGQCAPHATAVYGQNYPMYEYERTCLSPGCNADGIGSGQINVGVLMPATVAAGAASGAATAVSPTATSLLLLLLLPCLVATVFLRAPPASAFST